MTVFLRDWFGFNLYGTGFNLLSFFGLTITYMYFQIRADGADPQRRHSTA